VTSFDVGAIVSGASLEANETCAVLASNDDGQSWTTVAAASGSTGSSEVANTESVSNDGGGLLVRLQVTNDNARDKCFLHELVVGVTYGTLA
jgi:hypothetical protein